VGAEGALRAFEDFDVVGRGETARTEEGVEGVQPPRAGLLGFALGRQAPLGDLHHAGRGRIDHAHHQGHHVGDGQVGKDQDVAVPVADHLGALRSDARLDIGAERFQAVFLRLAPAGFPAGHGTAPARLEMHGGMPVAEVIAGAAHAAGDVGAGALEEAEVGRVQRHRMVEVDDVLHLQLPVRPRGVELGALDDFHAVAALVGEIVEITRRVSEVGHQIGRVRIEADEDEFPAASSLRGKDKTLNMNGTEVAWDAYAKIKAPGFKSEEEKEETLIKEGETIRLADFEAYVAALEEGDVADLTVGVRATTVNEYTYFDEELQEEVTVDDSIKLVDSEAEFYIDFEEFTDTRFGIPDGYGNLDWDETEFLIGIIDTVTYPLNPSGYKNLSDSGLGDNVGYINNTGWSTAGNDFDFISGQFTAAWNDGLNVTITAFDDGAQAGQVSFQVDTNEVAKIDFATETIAGIDTLGSFSGTFESIDRVEFVTSGGVDAGLAGGGTFLGMDNLFLEFEA